MGSYPEINERGIHARAGEKRGHVLETDFHYVSAAVFQRNHTVRCRLMHLVAG